VRTRVIQAAVELGYRRDPRLSELMFHLRRGRERTFHGNLAWITNLDPSDPDMAALMRSFHESARERAKELGYGLEPFFPVTPEDAPRLARTFHAQGIREVWASIFWEVDYAQWNWDWNQFRFVHHGAEPASRIVDVVDAEDRQNIGLLFRSLADRGYRRIGVATTHYLEREALFELCAGQTRFLLRYPEQARIEPCLVPQLEGAESTILDWIRSNEVDCVVSRWRGMSGVLDRIGYRVPEDIGLAYVTVRPGQGTEGDASGIDVNAERIAATAVETVISGLERGQFGLPSVPTQTLVPGRWHQGATCRDV
jgi:LacI family transcriptional regulator